MINKGGLINGDSKNLTLKEKCLYMSFHIGVFFRELILPSKYKSEIIKINEGFSSTLNSPFRDYIDMFLSEELNSQNKENVSVLDIGCGEGYTYKKLLDEGFIGSYTGIDVKKSSIFDAYLSPMLDKKFIKCSAEDITIQTKFDLIISVTSLEHIDNEKKVIKNIKDLLAEGGTEIHIVPASATIFLYFLHGWRQYSIKMLSNLMKDRDVISVHQGGGFASFLFHFLFITLPIKLRLDYKKSGKIFIKLKHLSMKLDKFLPFLPVVYCVTSKKQRNQ
jgi:SAM-dependent methyltransferase